MGQREDVQRSLMSEGQARDGCARKVLDAVGVRCLCTGLEPDADGQVDQIVNPACPTCAPAVSVNRQGWRARLAHVEALLRRYVEAVENGDRDAEMARPDADVEQALAEVRAMIDGEGE